ncbi:MAG: GTPase HflX [Chlamydiales bacterium]
MAEHEERAIVEQLSRALLLGVYHIPQERSAAEEHLNELEDLSNTYGFEVIKKLPIHLRQVSSKTLLGSGKIEEICEMIEELKIDLIILDDEVTPNQQRNLEKEFKIPTLDRTELILEIFSKHAKTKEAKLQIELATSRYQLPRLKRLWTHLSRQTSKGGSSFARGMGEKQIEVDKRLIQSRISFLQKEIEKVRAVRKTQRRQRERTKIPTFGIIGYTNAGKSTLLHALTEADILCEDKLFATLDTTTRKFHLPSGQPILLIDTVGFIRKIPHHLVAAFKSTLEEVLYTDILLHVVDTSHPAAVEQAVESLSVLKDLGGEKKPVITLLNKVDKLTSSAFLHRLKLRFVKTVPISSLLKEGFPELLERMEHEIRALRSNVRLRVPQSKFELIARIQREGRVDKIDYEENDVLLEADIPKVLEREMKEFIL